MDSYDYGKYFTRDVWQYALFERSDIGAEYFSVLYNLESYK